jgi:hypothetical protein
MSDFDRDVLEVVTDVDGETWELRELVELRGAELVSRVINDGFASVAAATLDDLAWREPLTPWPELTTDESLRLVRLESIPSGYLIFHAVGSLTLQGAPTLVVRYTADDPEAIAEVKARNKEGHEAALEMMRRWSTL